ncbi:unknown [Firmicutes bacterium CAG:534]|nr:unknown [Firmicutes bacterium CAG:534]
MSMDKGSVIGSPGCHYMINILKGSFSCQPGYKPGGRPGRIRPLIDLVMNLLREGNAAAFGNLQNRPYALYQIDPYHGELHLGVRFKMGRIAAAPELTKLRRAPVCSLQAGVNVSFRHLPPVFHNRCFVFIQAFACSVQAGRPGIDQVDKSILCRSFRFPPCYTLHCRRAPITPDI